MHIVVCVKYVPDAAATPRFRPNHTMDRTGLDGLLSQLDEYALEQALQLQCAADEQVQVTVLTVGPPRAADAARKALQMGADRAVHVQDEAIAGSDAVATSLVLAKAIEKVGPVDIVLCGMASTDGAMSVVPAMLAERLGFPQVTFGSRIERKGHQIAVQRDCDLTTDVIIAAMPLVASVTDQTGEARQPSFNGIMAAKKKHLTTLALGDLGIEPSQVGIGSAWCSVTETNDRPPRNAGQLVKDEDGTGAAALLDFLAAKKFI